MRRPRRSRAGRALAALLAAVAAATPVLLTTSPSAASQDTTASLDSATGSVTVVVTSMNPQWATPGSVLTVTGALVNHSRHALTDPAVALAGSATPLSSVAELQHSFGRADNLASRALPGATWHDSGDLAPGATAAWSIQVRTSSIGMTTFGVYPLAAVALTAAGLPLAAPSTTYLPYLPASKGAFHKSRPAPEQIAWVWPLIDKPLLDEPFADDCAGPGPSALAASLASGGRLETLLAAGSAAAATDHITWAIDPALLANARALGTCTGATARAASAWLSEVRSATAGQPLFVTPYADVDADALISVGHAADAATAFRVGRAVASRILDRDVAPVIGQPTSTFWPSGPINYFTLENLVPQADVQTVLLSSSALPGGQTVVQTPSGQGNYVNVLLADSGLSSLLGSATGAPGSAFATAQAFLAQTALEAEFDPGRPIVAAPPQRWQPPAGLAADLLAETASAPWLSPVALTGLTAGTHIKRVATLTPGSATAGNTPGTTFTVRELHQLGVLDQQISLQESIRAMPDNGLFLALATVESSAWQGQPGETLTLLRSVLGKLATQASAVQIVADTHFTLGGLRGNVPVPIDNRLGSAVRVRLSWQLSSVTGMQAFADPSAVVTIPAHTVKIVRLRVQAAQTGSTTITLRVASPSGQALPAAPAQMTIQATQDGTLGLIIFACAIGVLLFASALRAARRGRPAPTADQVPAAAAAAAAAEGAEEAAAPDTVMAEPSGLGAAGPPAP